MVRKLLWRRCRLAPKKVSPKRENDRKLTLHNLTLLSQSHTRIIKSISFFSYVVLYNEFLLIPFEVEAFDVVEELSGGDHVSKLKLALVLVYAFAAI